MVCTETFIHWDQRQFYFRLRGYGLAFDMGLPVMFSERNGYRKVWRFGRLSVQFLAPST